LKGEKRQSCDNGKRERERGGGEREREREGERERKKERGCFYYIIVQTGDVGLHSRRRSNRPTQRHIAGKTDRYGRSTAMWEKGREVASVLKKEKNKKSALSWKVRVDE